MFLVSSERPGLPVIGAAESQSSDVKAAYHLSLGRLSGEAHQLDLRMGSPLASGDYWFRDRSFLMHTA